MAQGDTVDFTEVLARLLHKHDPEYSLWEGNEDYYKEYAENILTEAREEGRASDNKLVIFRRWGFTADDVIAEQDARAEAAKTSETPAK